MPRRTAEARAASLLHAGVTPPPPPKDLSAAARDLWVSITRSKPADWWQGEGGLRLLRRFVRVSLLCEEVHDRLDRLGLDDPAAPELLKLTLQTSTALGVLGAKLRLNPQAGIERHAAHRFEPGAGVISDLIGGHALAEYRAAKPWE